jgi:7,8-dihydropterin-6-yl-methyl-4-(beta-D-ribofuranosyl)aminobenzene 5'-phosphate synthase
MIKKLKITTLVDNHTLFASGFWAEHGLSMLIEADCEKILFDTGQTSEVIAHNLEKIKENLNDLKHIVLSHGHYDHTGGLKEIAQRTDHAHVFAHPDIFDNKYVKRDEEYIDIGVPFNEDDLKNSFTFHFKKEGEEFIPSVRTTGQIPRITEFESIPKRYYIKKNNTFVNDEILDDQSLILDTQKGIIVILGCTHSGLINTLFHVKKLTGKSEVFGIFGGTHLWAADDEKLKKTAMTLNEFNLKRIGLSHCSGENALLHFSKAFGDKVFLNSAGSVIEI